MREIKTVVSRHRGGIKGESSRAEAYGVLPGEDRFVREIMTREVVSLPSFMSLEAVHELYRGQKKTILVVNEAEEPAYALPELDLALANPAGVDLTRPQTLHDLLKDRVAVRCREDAILADAIHEMVAYHISHVPVLNLQGGLIGALSLLDVIGALSPPAAARWLSKIRGWLAISL
ncbi:MAG TPA: CBS domain-containing protein [Nitrospira sp.]|nr:CBS domain-containing protein [Nitrospira sp.]